MSEANRATVAEFRAFILETEGRLPSPQAEVLLVRALVLVDNGQLAIEDVGDVEKLKQWRQAALPVPSPAS